MNFQDKTSLINKAATYTPAQKEIMRQVYHMSWDEIARLPHEQKQIGIYYKSELEKFPPEFLKEQEFLSHPQVRQAQVQQSNFQEQQTLGHFNAIRHAVVSATNAPNRLALGQPVQKSYAQPVLPQQRSMSYATGQQSAGIVNKSESVKDKDLLVTPDNQQLYKVVRTEYKNGQKNTYMGALTLRNLLEGEDLYIKKGPGSYSYVGKAGTIHDILGLKHADYGLATKSQVQAPTLPISPITGQPSQFTQVVRRSLGLDAPQATNVTRQATNSGLQVPQLSQKAETQQGLVSPEHYNRLAVYRSMYGQQPQTMGEYLQRCNEAAFAQKAHAAQVAARTVRVDLNYQ